LTPSDNEDVHSEEDHLDMAYNNALLNLRMHIDKLEPSINRLYDPQGYLMEVDKFKSNIDEYQYNHEFMNLEHLKHTENNEIENNETDEDKIANIERIENNNNNIEEESFKIDKNNFKFR